MHWIDIGLTAAMKVTIALICTLAVVCCSLLQISAAKRVNSQSDDYRDDGDVYQSGKKCQEGTATVSRSGKDCPSSYTGTSQTAQATGNSVHDTCTAAKNEARDQLRAAVPAGCHKYITSNSPCKNC